MSTHSACTLHVYYLSLTRIDTNSSGVHKTQALQYYEVKAVGHTFPSLIDLSVRYTPCIYLLTNGIPFISQLTELLKGPREISFQYRSKLCIHMKYIHVHYMCTCT